MDAADVGFGAVERRMRAARVGREADIVDVDGDPSVVRGKHDLVRIIGVELHRVHGADACCGPAPNAWQENALGRPDERWCKNAADIDGVEAVLKAVGACLSGCGEDDVEL